MFQTSNQTLDQLGHLLGQLTNEVYSQPCSILSDATIGQHTRHILELYQCLIDGYEGGKVSYDNRKRDKRIEKDLDFALNSLANIQKNLEKPNKPIEMEYELNGVQNTVDSNYHREVIYNLEHAIHHHALIKVGLLTLTQLELPESFGVAPSTQQYKKSCAR